MPYTKPECREPFEHLVRDMCLADIKTGGDLNYLITRLVHAFLSQRPKSYQAFSDAGFALLGAERELYRRFTAPYEDEKIKQNGDVP